MRVCHNPPNLSDSLSVVFVFPLLFEEIFCHSEHLEKADSVREATQHSLLAYREIQGAFVFKGAGF